MRGLFPVTGEDVVAGFVLRSPFFFGLDSVLGELTDGRPLGREGGPALDVTGKIVPRADTPLGRDPGSNGSNAMAVAPGRSTDGATRLVSHSDRKSTRLNSSHYCASRLPSSACTQKTYEEYQKS